MYIVYTFVFMSNKIVSYLILSYTDFALNNPLITGMYIMINIWLNYDTHMYTYIHIFKPTLLSQI